MSAAAMLLLAAAAEPLVFDARAPRRPACVADGDDIVVCAARGGNGTLVPIRYKDATGWLRVDPGGPRRPSCNPDFVLRARITGRGPVTLSSVGPVEVKGGIGEVAFRIGDSVWRREIDWSDQPAVVGADCIVGPEGLDAPVVRFQLGEATPTMRTVALSRYRSPQYTHIAYAGVRVGDTTIPTRFDLQRPETVLTAPATRDVAPVLIATVTGPVATIDIIRSVRRPVRRLNLGRPLVVGPLTITRTFSRVRDYGGSLHVRTADPDEDLADQIVVANKRITDRGSRIIRVGWEDLSRCADITFDRPAREIRLTC